MKLYLTNTEVYKLSCTIAEHIKRDFDLGMERSVKIYGWPRGGVPVAYLLVNMSVYFELVNEPENADVIIDDLIDSGETGNRICEEFTHVSFYVLIDKRIDKEYKNRWLVFPWEVGHDKDNSADDIGIRLLQRIGEDPNRDGLKDTPKRYIKAWEELMTGYKQHPEEVLKVTFENIEHYDEMIILKDIEFYSMCEHHLLPFFGKVHIAYLPNFGTTEYRGKDQVSGEVFGGEDTKPGKIVGISKLARLVDIYARRLQTQERLTEQIARALEKYLCPLGVAVYVEAQHFCMISRGVQKQNSVMITSSLKGNLRKESARMESLFLIKG